MNKKENHTDFKNKFKKLVAFSLAEVLITMGIIGVVAAITIPSLVSSVKKQETETKLVKFYSSINQAIKLAEIQYGDKKDWEEPAATSESCIAWVEKYLRPYMNIAKVEATSDGKKAQVTLNDGSIFVASDSMWAWLFFTQDCGDNCKAGIDFFYFHFKPSYSVSEKDKYHYDKGVEPYKFSWNGTRGDLLNNSTYGCPNGSNGPAYCTALIQLNGWKIPRDYPLKY